MIDLKQKKTDFAKHIDHLTQELGAMRTGRAHGALVENISVDAYGSLTPLKQLASISIPDARTILISPWDKNILKDIEKAIINAHTGLTSMNDGSVVRVPIPALTEESRKNLVKIVWQKVEQAKIGIRTLRDKIKEEIGKEEKAKELTEDDRYTLVKELDDMTKDYTAQAESVGNGKEKEILTI
jgi:ribosome recycling factor